MKKLILLMAILGSMTVFAESREDVVENQLMKKYPTLTDGTNTIKVKEYDVDIKRGKTEIKIELRGDADKAAFEKFNKEKLGTILTDMTKYAQNELTKPLPIEVEVELDKEIYPDETLYRNTFLD